MRTCLSSLAGFVAARHGLILFFIVFSIAAFIGTLIILPLVIVRLPENYFRTLKDGTGAAAAVRFRSRLLRAGQNLLGAVLLLMGIVMLGLPGQGILTIILGLMLLDFPGKRKLIRRLVKKPAVKKALNGIRRRAGRPEFRF